MCDEGRKIRDGVDEGSKICDGVDDGDSVKCKSTFII